MPKEQHFMRLLVMFDLPVVSKDNRRDYTRFRNFLLSIGFIMIQYSVYMRLCNGLESTRKYEQQVRYHVPPMGFVRSLCITEKQFMNMHCLLGDATPTEKYQSPQQLLFF